MTNHVSTEPLRLQDVQRKARFGHKDWLWWKNRAESGGQVFEVPPGGTLNIE